MANSKPGTNPRKAWDDIIMKNRLRFKKRGNCWMPQLYFFAVSNSNSRLTVSEGLQAATNDAKMAFIVTDGMVQFSGYYPCNVRGRFPQFENIVFIKIENCCYTNKGDLCSDLHRGLDGLRDRLQQKLPAQAPV